jgi:2-polyprenyl-6-methoxyphenol hydroxylase-like FAD-dependent oxidoreductase
MTDTIQPELSEGTILIIGGGLAGLGLAQGLKQQNIPFRVFERDTSASFRAQGYRIRISSDGAQALKQLLPQHLFDAFEATCADIVHGGHAVNAATGGELEFHIPGGGPHGSGKAYNADRVVLRNLLLSELEEKVEFGKRLERFEVRDDGVVAYFTDGSTAKGELLIGADGVKSVVRRQFLPDSG